jgi:hypothetical protein
MLGGVVATLTFLLLQARLQRRRAAAPARS